MRKSIIQVLKYIVLIFAGILLVLFCSTIQHAALSQPGEYYYSGFLRNNYTVICASLFFIIGIVVGYFFRLNPWFSGLSLIFIYPMVSFYEATVYRGSHNLIPFELVVYFLFSLPGVFGVYLGRYVLRKIAISKQQIK